MEVMQVLFQGLLGEVLLLISPIAAAAEPMGACRRGNTLVHAPIAAVIVTVALPGSVAYPAKLILALAARHVVAAAVALNGRLAARADACVDLDPVVRLRVIPALFAPLLHTRPRE